MDSAAADSVVAASAVVVHLADGSKGLTNSDLVIYYENSSFFGVLPGVMKSSAGMVFRFRVSGVRPALAFSLLTPDT